NRERNVRGCQLKLGDRRPIFQITCRRRYAGEWQVSNSECGMAKTAKIVEAARRLIEPGEAVLVAVSGGVDSMVLLDVLFRESKELGLRLHVAHLNHQLRGRSSDGDEALVRKTAKQLRLPISVERIAVGEIARTRKVSIE